MKSTTKMMVVAVVMLAIAALFVAPAAARDLTINNISNGDTVFVWEENLNFSLVNATLAQAPQQSDASLRMYTDDSPATKSAVNIISLSNLSNVSLLSSSVNSYFGTYRLYNATVGYTRESIVIAQPNPSLDVVLATDHTSSVNGDSIDQSTGIAFKVISPKVGAYYNYQNAAGTKANGAKARLEFTTPSGGKTFILNDTSFTAFWVNSTQFYTDDFDPAANVTYLENEEAGTYSAVLKWRVPSGFKDYAPSSEAVTFTVETRSVSITSEKTSVIRGNNFVTTIAGKSNVVYYVYAKNAQLTGTDEYPRILTGQPSVDINDNWAIFSSQVSDAPLTNNGASGYAYANVTTKADGSRPVEWKTSAATSDITFTIKVVDPRDTSLYDTVKVKVEKGAVTVTASGDGSYYLGEEIVLSGTNTDSNKVYLFMTGPNLGTNGVALDNTSNGATVSRNVESDDTWSYKWNTAADAVTLDAGTYTVYASSENVMKNQLSGKKYDTVSVVIRKPFIQATTSSSTVAKGDKFYITGTAEGDPSSIAIWILGKNFYSYSTETVDDNMAFSKEIGTAETKDMASGQYFIVAQHPMYNGQLDVKPNGTNPTYVVNIITRANNSAYTEEFIINGTGKLQGSDAAQALVDAINSANIDDTYWKLSVMIEEPWIRIAPVGDKNVGDAFAIAGTTNLAVDDDLIIEVTSASFKPTSKEVSSEFTGSSGTVKVVAGDNYNDWVYDVDTATWKADEYIVNVESVEADTTQTTTFNLLAAGAPTAVPTAAPVTPTAAPTAAPTAVPTPVETATPGFGALIALIGLGAVAALVMRKD